MSPRTLKIGGFYVLAVIVFCLPIWFAEFGKSGRGGADLLFWIYAPMIAFALLVELVLGSKDWLFDTTWLTAASSLLFSLVFFSPMLFWVLSRKKALLWVQAALLVLGFLFAGLMALGGGKG